MLQRIIDNILFKVVAHRNIQLGDWQTRRHLHCLTPEQVRDAKRHLNNFSWEVFPNNWESEFSPRDVAVHSRAEQRLTKLHKHIATVQAAPDFQNRCVADMEKMVSAGASDLDYLFQPSDIVVFTVTWPSSTQFACVGLYLPTITLASHPNWALVQTSYKVWCLLSEIEHLPDTLDMIATNRVRFGIPVASPSREVLECAAKLWDPMSVYADIASATAAASLLV